MFSFEAKILCLCFRALILSDEEIHWNGKPACTKSVQFTRLTQLVGIMHGHPNPQLAKVQFGPVPAVHTIRRYNSLIDFFLYVVIPCTNAHTAIICLRPQVIIYMCFRSSLIKLVAP